MSMVALALFGLDQLVSRGSDLGPMIILYVGPDQLLPLASGLAAVVGFLLIVWHRALALGRRVLQSFIKKFQPSTKG